MDLMGRAMRLLPGGERLMNDQRTGSTRTELRRFFPQLKQEVLDWVLAEQLAGRRQTERRKSCR